MLADSLNALRNALALALPARVVTRDFLHSDHRLESELEAGVLTITASRESNYANYRGREAQMGRLSVLVIGQLKLVESALPSEVEDAEFSFAEEVKEFLAGALPVQAIDLLETRFSEQIYAPYGGFAMDWEVWP